MSKTGTQSKKSTESALTVSGPQPVWMTLNEARERAFTGEVVFEVEPEVLAYLDNGVVYYAERSADASLGRRLVDAGVLDTSQLERGTVRVGDVEHLGRLFDRDPSVDRDAVLVVAEADTEMLISQLANEAITTARVTAYRHHPSGVHRWFVGPVEPAANPRPISEVAQLDTTVVDDLPGLPVASATDTEDESLDGFEELEPLPTIDEFDASMLEAMLDGGGDVEIIPDTPEDDIADWDESVEALLDFTADPDSADVVQIDPEATVKESEQDQDLPVEPTFDGPLIVAEDVIFEEIIFDDIVVEDVVEDDVTAVVVDFVEDIVVEDVVVEDVVVEDVVVEDVVVEDVPVEVVETATDDAALTVAETDTIVEDEESVWDVDTSDDVVDREFQVVWPDESDDDDNVEVIIEDSVDESDFVEIGPLEQEATETPIIQTTADGLYFEMPPLDLGDEQTTDDVVPDDVADAVRRAIAAIETAAVGSPSIAPIADAGPGDLDVPAAPVASGLDVFAPPSMDSSAEALYSQLEAAAAVSASGVSAESPSEGPTEPGEDDANERSSALRRLIGSLRRKGK